MSPPKKEKKTKHGAKAKLQDGSSTSKIFDPYRMRGCLMSSCPGKFLGLNLQTWGNLSPLIPQRPYHPAYNHSYGQCFYPSSPTGLLDAKEIGPCPKET